MASIKNVGALLILVGSLTGCASAPDAPAADVPPLLGTSAARATSRDDLSQTTAAMQARLAINQADAPAAVTLADALLRQTRVTGNAGLAIKAEQALVRVLVTEPERYDVRRMLAAVYLSEHRFEDAIREAERCRSMKPGDSWVDGVIGDAHLELGHYEKAFDAFDQMNARKPTAASYARASYARELQGDRASAIRFMRMALEATPASDPESQAWHHAQLGYLLLADHRLPDADREFAHADHLFPGHPFAQDGLARTAAAGGDYRKALDIIAARIQHSPTAADLALAGDLLAALAQPAEAERHYRLAEAAWRDDTPEPTRLARFQAEHNRNLDEAVRIATTSWASRQDIFTADALAWAHFQQGNLELADRFITQALRTGSQDADIRRHAAVIAAARSKTAARQVRR